MPTVTSRDGTKIAFEKVGSGPAVILVNGAISYRRAFDTTLEELAELLSKDFTVYDYDRRGRGESGNTEPFTKVREIEDIRALIEDAGGEAMLVGFSSGGVVTLETTAVTPGVTKAFVYEVLLALLDEISCGGEQVHDANIVAMMLVHGVDTLVTINSGDFVRFEELVRVRGL